MYPLDLRLKLHVPLGLRVRLHILLFNGNLAYLLSQATYYCAIGLQIMTYRAFISKNLRAFILLTGKAL